MESYLIFQAKLVGLLICLSTISETTGHPSLPTSLKWVFSMPTAKLYTGIHVPTNSFEDLIRLGLIDEAMHGRFRGA